jgi:hypothetical protein
MLKKYACNLLLDSAIICLYRFVPFFLPFGRNVCTCSNFFLITSLIHSIFQNCRVYLQYPNMIAFDGPLRSNIQKYLV